MTKEVTIALTFAFITYIFENWYGDQNLFFVLQNFDKQDEMRLLAKFRKFCTWGSEPHTGIKFFNVDIMHSCTHSLTIACHV